MELDYKEQKKQLIDLATTQQMAAANPEMSVWVEASAGTGKTKVLSDRVLRLLLAKVNPAKLLCLTYTKAAAVEMNERIAKRLSSWAVESNQELEEELRQLLGEKFDENNPEELLSFARTLFAVLLDTPGGMKIQTIHSFCEDILKRFPLEAGISPYFEVLDDRNAKEILQNIKLDLLKMTENEDNVELKQAICYLIEHISEYQFPQIMNMITENRSKVSQLLKMYHDDITAITKSLEIKLGVRADLTEKQLKLNALNNIDVATISKAIDVFSQGGAEDLKRAKMLADVLEHCSSAEVYESYKAVFLTDKDTVRARLTSQKASTAMPELADFMQNEAERILKVQKEIVSLNVLLATVAVLHIAQHIIKQYDNYKEIYAVLDYEDLIAITRQLLENRDVADWVLFKLDGGIDHILIDEAQDTSPNQWAIIRALTQEFFAGNGQYDEFLARTVFVVGDRKQSIYSFQGADPHEFDRMFHYFNNRIQHFAKVHLDVSFRSTKAIMDCVNTLFEAPEAKKGVVPDGEHINHRPFRLGDGGQVEIFPLLKENEDNAKNDYNWVLPVIREQKTSLSNMLARQIALNIKKMVASGELLASKNRPLRYGDFMFLVQQRNAFVEEFVRACKDIGVKVAGVDKLKLLEQIAVQDLISLGRFLLLPNDDLSLAEALKSPIFGLTDDDLFKLCYNRSGSLFSSLLKDDNYGDCAQRLKVLLNMSGFTRPFELFNFVLVNMEGRKNFVSRMGIEVEDVLDEFLNLTLLFEQKHTPTLQSFISWIVQDEVIIKKEMEQGDDDTVKIMTVHGSKGLQAPIVILADTTKTKNTAFASEFLWEDGQLFFPTSSAQYDDICKKIKQKHLDADFDEYRRLLYVALTRAEDRLYIAGYTKEKNPKQESWYKLLENNISSNVPLRDEDKRIVYYVEQKNPFKPARKESNLETQTKDYRFLLCPAPVENPLAKPFAPSHDDNDETEITASPLEDEGKFYARGTAMHKLLQYIPNVDCCYRQKAALAFVQKELPDFSASELNKMVSEVLNLCSKFPEIFQKNSLAEVPIIGEVGGKIVSAKIDRLIVLPDKILVVDYKTNRPAALTKDEVPDLYVKQLSAYKSLIAKIYPSKDIETYILWTNTCHMMEI